jgi:hypothetical protein
MPPAVPHELGLGGLVGTGGLVCFMGASQMEVEHGPGVVGVLVNDLRSRDAITVGEIRVEGEIVALLREILGDETPFEPVVELFPNVAVQGGAEALVDRRAAVP